MFHATKRFMRMSLFKWLLIFSIACLATFAVAQFVRTAQLEANAIRGLENLGLEVTYKYEHELGPSGRHVPPGPDWVKAIFGELVLARIEFVQFSGKMKTLDGCRDYLDQLGHLKTLTILSNELENINALKHLKGLESVCFFGNLGGTKDIDVLSSLNLRRVSFIGYNGLTSLDSLGKIASLEELSIQLCNGVQELNLNDWEAVKLQKVDIKNCCEIITVSGPPHGSENCSLTLSDCSALEKIMLQQDSRLGFISVNNCPKLSSIGVMPESLATNQDLTKSDSLLAKKGQKLPRLSSASISSCDELFSFDVVFENAESIWLTECDGLRNLDLLQAIPKLKRVRVESCNGLVSITGLPESLENLKLINCQSLSRVAPADKLPKLKCFDLEKCPNLLDRPRVKARGITW